MSVTPISSGMAAPPTAPAHFNAAALRNAAPETQRSAVAQQFEAVLVRQLLGKTMSSMLGGNEGGAASSVYGDMLTDTLSQQLTSGRGLGLGRFIEKQLTPHGVVVSDPAAAPAAQPKSPSS